MSIHMPMIIQGGIVNNIIIVFAQFAANTHDHIRNSIISYALDYLLIFLQFFRVNIISQKYSTAGFVCTDLIFAVLKN